MAGALRALRGRVRADARAAASVPRLRMTGTRTAAVLVAVLVPSAAAWFVALQQMRGMDMGVATELGSLQFFLAVWVAMMAAMMLPGALRVLVLRGRWGRRVLTVPVLALS